MSQPNFYNVNTRRAYPFEVYTVGVPVEGPTTLKHMPDEAIVDAGFRMSAKSRFADGADQVYLARVRRSGTTFFFEFESTAPELFGVKLVFRRNVNDPDYTVQFTDSGDTGLSDSSQSFSSTACEEPLWSGFLVTGKMQSLDSWLVSDGEVERGSGDTVVEPALAHNLAGAYVTRVALANDDRTRVSAPNGCPDVVYPFTPQALWIFDNCLVGDIVFKAGYNADVRQNDTENSITLAASIGAGEGQPCKPVPLFPGETPPLDSDLLEGGLQCNQTLRSINGVGGPQYNINAGTGVVVSSVPDANTVIIDVNMSGLIICFAQSHISESC